MAKQILRIDPGRGQEDLKQGGQKPGFFKKKTWVIGFLGFSSCFLGFSGFFQGFWVFLIFYILGKVRRSR
jgi:hypothetical protein